MVTRAALMDEAVGVSGGHARPPAGRSDVVDGVTPSVVIEPPDAAGVGAVLAWATASHLTVVVRGSGSKDGWGRPPRAIDLLLRTGGLRRVIAHEASDLTITVEAGARLRDVNRSLASHRQQIPLDPPHEDATIGGILATNDSGPLRQRHGTPRDLVIGMTVVMADGLVAASGGRVVKNVAGYDIGRLMTGSHGCLAVITSASFKLAPLVQATRTLRVQLAGPPDAVAFVDRLRQEQCEPEALDVHLSRRGPVDRTAVLVRFASVEPAVEEAVVQARTIAGQFGASVEVSGGPQADGWWTLQREAPSGDGRLHLRLAWKPAEFARVADAVLAATRGLDVELAGRAGIGAAICRVDGTAAQQADVVRALRASPVCRHVVILDGPVEVRRQCGVWPAPSASAALSSALKQSCDPGDTLGAGRGPL